MILWDLIQNVKIEYYFYKIPGEQQDPDTDMAPLKTFETIKSVIS